MMEVILESKLSSAGAIKLGDTWHVSPYAFTMLAVLIVEPIFPIPQLWLDYNDEYKKLVAENATLKADNAMLISINDALKEVE